MFAKKEMAYKELIVRMVAVSLLFSVVFGFIASVYLKERAIADMARSDAKKTSELVFQGLYSAMAKGWSKDDLHSIVERLNKIEPNMKINVYRSAQVASEFGDLPSDKKAREGDELIKKAMGGAELLIPREDDTIRYLYPIFVKEECKSCHVNAKKGDVNGVIDISYPIDKVKVSLSLMLNSFLLFFTFFIIAIFATLYFNLNRLLVKPLESFIGDIRDIIYKNDLTTRVKIETRIKEVKNIERFFNKLLDSLQDYYERLRELSDKDFLTKLYNRKKFEEFLDYEIGRATRHKYSFCVVMIDLDNFKYVNDTYGHPIGDLALKEASSIFRKHIRSADVAARVGGDEFAIILMEADENEGVEIVNRLKDALSNTDIVIPNGKVRITASFGIIEFPRQAGDLKDLMVGADIAMYKAKKAGKNAVALSEEDDAAINAEIFKTGEFIKTAIDEDRLLPFYQPIVDITTGELYAYEVLARIKETDGEGYIGAAQFIETSERLDLTKLIDKTVLKKALQDRKNSKNPNVCLFLNLSGKAFFDIEFIKEMADMLEDGLIEKNSNLVLEITEREAVPNITEFIPLIDKMKKFEVRFALDDFGSGFSSFLYLKYMDVDIVKIDGAFVRNIVANYKDEVFVRHINEISKEFGKITVAEYVEDKETLAALRRIGVTLAQGFYIGAPSGEMDWSPTF